MDARMPENPDPLLMNADLAPVLESERSFDARDVCSLWIGLVVCVPAWTLASSVISMGFSATQALCAILVANTVVLVPMIANGHAGTKYGVSFPVLCRSAFGIRGANVAALARAGVATGWFGIQTNMGGQALSAVVRAMAPGSFGASESVVVSWLGLSALDFACYCAFLAAQLYVVYNGIESIRKLEEYAAPVLIALSLALFVWAITAAGGLGSMLGAPSAFVAGGAKEGMFWNALFPIITATVGFWSTLSLNISDFTRYAKSQRVQMVGQALGLPFFMAAFSFISLAVTSCTVVIFGHAITHPITLLSKMDNNPLATILAMTGLALATLSTNIAANVVAPANALVNAFPKQMSFRRAGFITAALATISMPWKLAAGDGYIFVWLIGYAALLGPITGIMIADYFLIRERRLDVNALYSMDKNSEYWFTRGFNLRAIASLLIGAGVCVPGFLHTIGLHPGCALAFRSVYDNAWFVSFFIGGGLYTLLATRPLARAKEALSRFRVWTY
jgi:NCS1 family nucleobase:cation symporter-1